MCGVAGQVAIVTGGSGGIGRAVCRALAGGGARVVIHYWRGNAPAEKLKEEIVAEGGHAITCQADVTDQASVNQLVKVAVDSFGSVTVLVNNAGIYPRSEALGLGEQEWDRVLDTNLKGTFLCSQIAAREMMQRGGGRIINISSGAAIKGVAQGIHYSAAKAGIIALTKSLARALSPWGIVVNCVAPGIVDTDMPRLELSEEDIQEWGRRIPMGRIGQPEDVARAVLFLASEDVTWITGQTIYVNGGDLMP